jgi:amino acid adenylation domain-containing protein
MVRHFQTLLEGIVNNPEQRLSDLPILTAKERQQLLVEWNETRVEYPRNTCIHQLFEVQAERMPDAIAVVFEDEDLTYRELNRRANQLAHYLQSHGVGPGALVAICTERSPEMVIGMLGILKSGGAYVPLDSAYPKERLAFMLEDSKAPVLLTQQRLIHRVAIEGVQLLCLDTDWQTIARASEANPASRVTPDSLAYVIYTSGSTGRPRGVEIRHSSLMNLVSWHQRVYSVRPSDRATQLAGPAFDASVWELWPYLRAGASIHIPDEATRTSPLKLIEWLATEEITFCFLATPLAESVLEASWPADLRLRVLLTGGDKLHRGPRRPLPFQLLNHYGPTENTVVTTWAPVDELGEIEAAPPIGRPISNVQVYVLDPHLNPVPIGVPGELHIGGDGLARGYLNQPKLTAEKFIPRPFSPEPGARLYKTGDLVRYRADGQLEFLGRIDQQVKLRGFRIELGEIEAVLRQYCSVREAVVLAREDVLGDKHLVAYLVPHQQSASFVSELRSFLQEKLPEYMIPSTFVLLDGLPLTPNGKVDRRKLPLSEQIRPEMERSCVAPRTPVEKMLAAIWVEILGLQQVGVEDNFFHLGGHSLLAMQLVSRIRNTLHVELPLRRLFESPTIVGLAQAIAGLQEAQPASPTESTEAIPRARQRLSIDIDQLSDAEVDSMLSGISAKGEAE